VHEWHDCQQQNLTMCRSMQQDLAIL